MSADRRQKNKGRESGRDIIFLYTSLLFSPQNEVSMSASRTHNRRTRTRTVTKYGFQSMFFYMSKMPLVKKYVQVKNAIAKRDTRLHAAV